MKKERQDLPNTIEKLKQKLLETGADLEGVEFEETTHRIGMDNVRGIQKTKANGEVVFYHHNKQD